MLLSFCLNFNQFQHGVAYKSVVYKKKRVDILIDFTKFTEKHLYQILYLIKLQAILKLYCKKRPWSQRFPVDFVEFLRKPFL